MQPAGPDPTPGAAPSAPVPASPATHRIEVVDGRGAAAAATDPVDADRLAGLAAHVLRALDVPTELEVSVSCVDDGRMRELNVEHLDGTGATDVLAFPIDAPDDVVPGVPGLLGDVVLCPTVARRQAAGLGRRAVDELDLLLVHGILHLLGHDHAEPTERTEMFALTDALLAAWAPPTGPGP